MASRTIFHINEIPEDLREYFEPAHNIHPTVKNVKLCQWLATLLLPPPEYAPRRLLVPFLGSGSEAIGAGLVGWEHITGIEMDADTCAIAEARLAHWLNEPRQLELHGA